MEVIKILIKKEYLTALILILLHIYIIISFHIFCSLNWLIYNFLINIVIMCFQFFLSIFLALQFDNNYFQILQIYLENKMNFLSLLSHISLIINYFIGQELFNLYLIYHDNCPFNLGEFDYKLHIKRRCELYNIINENFLFQYICSYNAEQNIKYLEKKYDSISQSDIKCSRVKKLINHNKIIISFAKEYYREDIYYCDLVKQPKTFPISLNPKYCDEKYDIQGISFVINFFLSIYFIYLNFSYFKNIKANVIVKPKHLF